MAFFSGLRDLDLSLSGGEGLPGGEILGIYGESGVGKTGLALWFARTYLQRHPEQWIGWISTEAPLTLDQLQWAGIDPQDVLLGEQQPGMNALALATELIHEGCPLVVVDSLAAVTHEQQSHRGAVGGGLVPLKRAASQRGALVIYTNQIRHIMQSRAHYPVAIGRLQQRMTDVMIHLKEGPGLYYHERRDGHRVLYALDKGGASEEQVPRSGRYSLYWSRGLQDVPTRRREIVELE